MAKFNTIKICNNVAYFRNNHYLCGINENIKTK